MLTGAVSMESPITNRVDPAESLSPSEHVPDAGVVYMYTRARKPQAHVKDGTYVARESRQLWFSEWAAKQANIHSSDLR